MKKNVGTYDALMRITCGLTGLAWGVAHLVRRPNSSLPFIITLASAMKVAEGITRFCPMLAMMGKNSLDTEEPIVGTINKAANKTMESSAKVGQTIEELANEMTEQFAREYQ